MRIRRTALVVMIVASCTLSVVAQKPKLTLDDFFNSASFRGLEISPDGNSVVIAGRTFSGRAARGGSTR